MTKYVFVGDIHGQWERVEEALAKPGKKIFVGDFMDSFTRDVRAMERCLDLVIRAIKSGEAEAIFGNHELSYLFPGTHRCSGYRLEHDAMMAQKRDDVLALFKSYIFINPEFLVSHAGLTELLWDNYMAGFPHAYRTAVLDAWWADVHSPMHWIGYRRGGGHRTGGMFWCDFNSEFEPVEGLTQVFGHTRGNGIRRLGTSYCIDCLEDVRESKFLEMDV
jgi:hypothetical protein